MEPNNGLSGLKIALLIDFDNVILGIDEPGFDVELVVNALRERGSIVMGRCYGDWYRHNRHRRKLMEQGLELVETPAFGPVIKNSADIRIALDGFEIGMTQHHIDTFCLVSGDSDFLPLIKKLQYLGKQVLVICGNKFTSDMLRRNCNEFISYENLLAQSVGALEDATTLDGAFQLLHRAIATLSERGSEIRSSTVKQMMIQLNPVFSEKTFSCNQFRQFLDKGVDAGIIKLGSRDKISGEFLVLLPEEEEGALASESGAFRPEGLEARTPLRAPREQRQESRGDRDVRLGSEPREREPRERPDRDRSDREPRDFRSQRATRRGQRQDDRALEPALAALPVPPNQGITPVEAQVTPGRPEKETNLDHGTTTTALLGRGLRRGRLRFTAKGGTGVQAVAPEAEATPIEEEVPAVIAEGTPGTETPTAGAPAEGETPVTETSGVSSPETVEVETPPAPIAPAASASAKAAAPTGPLRFQLPTSPGIEALNALNKVADEVEAAALANFNSQANPEAEAEADNAQPKGRSRTRTRRPRSGGERTTAATTAVPTAATTAAPTAVPTAVPTAEAATAVVEDKAATEDAVVSTAGVAHEIVTTPEPETPAAPRKTSRPPRKTAAAKAKKVSAATSAEAAPEPKATETPTTKVAETATVEDAGAKAKKPASRARAPRKTTAGTKATKTAPPKAD